MPQLPLNALLKKFPHGFNTVILDCDSTLSGIEGIAHLAVDHKAEIDALTDSAMQGEIPLESVYGRRLELVRPHKSSIDALGAQYIQYLAEDGYAVTRELQNAGIDVHIVSGGLRPAVLHLGKYLNIPDDNVTAVDVYFDADGNYAGFDETSPLSRSFGKLELIKSWLPGPRHPIMMVGDGSTDLEAAPVVDLFVGYAGVIARDPVIAHAEIVIWSQSLAPVFTLAIGNARATALSSGAQQLHAKGAALLNALEES